MPLMDTSKPGSSSGSSCAKRHDNCQTIASYQRCGISSVSVIVPTSMM
ncbi:MAG: hypothetical protein ACK55Z_01620 [bacterium]